MGQYKQYTKIACVAFAGSCPRSQVDASLLIEYLASNGWKISNDFKEANLILLGTCGFDKFAEDRSIEYISVVEKKKNNSKLIVFGCLPSINEKKLLEKFNIITITPRTLDKLDEIINASTKFEQIINPGVMEDYKYTVFDSFTPFERLTVKSQLSIKYPFRALSRIFLGKGAKPLYYRYENVFNIRIARGCLGECTYCAIKNAYGTLISNPLDTIVSEFRTGLGKGYRVFRLVAGDIGSYGQDIGTNIIELIQSLLDHKGNFKIIWDDFNPRWLTQYFPELIGIIENKISKIGYMGFPIQSGSEKILRLMKRNYTAKVTKIHLIALQQAFPDLEMTTHVLIGFPGEKDEDFNETIRFLESVNFNHIEVFLYSDRPNIPAIELPGKISEKVKAQRAMKLKKHFHDIFQLL
jgi:tRNA A37 methylthiotransferase MiaB